MTLPGLATGTHTLTATQASPAATAKRVILVDVTPPAITVRAPAQGAVYLPGQAVEVDFSCSGAVACVGQVPDGALLPTATAGPASFAVGAVDAAGNAADRSVVYSVGPAAPTISVRPGGPVMGARPRFAWVGGEPGATFTWQVLSGGTVISQGDTPAAEVSLGPLAPGAYAFQVRQTVASGRTGPFSVADPFTVTRRVTAAGPARPPTRNAGALRPRAGSVTTAARPLLSWRGSRGADLYNLQVFRVTSSGMAKVRSAFPRGTRARVTGLRFGDRYAWRIWPFVAGRGYASKPLGLSYFDLARPVRLTPAQMGTNRRIAVSAVRRVAAIEAWLDAGIAAGDLRHQGLGAVAFDPALGPTGPEDAGGTAAAAVRPIGLGDGPRGRRTLAVSARTLRETRLIGRAALRRVDALEARLEAGLTGGDVVDGAIGAEKLAPVVVLTRARASTAAAPPSLARPGPAARVTAVPVTRARLLAAQRVAQGAVRRAEALRLRLLQGLSTADFAPGSLGAADLAPALRR